MFRSGEELNVVSKVQRYDSTFLRRIEEAENTYSYYFTKPEGFDFKAGQFIRVILTHPRTEEKESRYFTISSSPNDKDIRLTVKIQDSPFKSMLENLKFDGYQGMEFYGPMGVFYIDKNTKGNFICYAHGVGITPFVSMMEYAAQEELDISMWIDGKFSKASLVPQKLQTELFKIFLGKGHFVADFHTRPQRITKDKLDITYMLCGSDDYVSQTFQKLVKKGVPEEKIKFEQFL